MSKSTKSTTSTKSAAEKFVQMCMEQHSQTPAELLASAKDDWKRLRKESGLERELELQVPHREYIVCKDGTVNFLDQPQPRAAK